MNREYVELEDIYNIILTIKEFNTKELLNSAFIRGYKKGWDESAKESIRIITKELLDNKS